MFKTTEKTLLNNGDKDQSLCTIMTEIFNYHCQLHGNQPQLKLNYKASIAMIGTFIIAAQLFNWLDGIYQSTSINPYDRLP